MVIRANDLLNWIDDSINWSYGLKPKENFTTKTDESIKSEDGVQKSEASTKLELTATVIRSLKQSQVDFTDVEAEKGETSTDK